MLLVTVAARWAIGVLLLRAGIGKLRLDPDGRGEVVARYGLLPAGSVRWAGSVIPAGETLLGAALLAGIAIRPAAALSAALLATFSAVIAANLVRGRRFACGCGGAGVAQHLISWRLAGQDMILAAAGALVAFSSASGLALWSGWGTHSASCECISLVPVPLLVVLLLAVGAAVRAGLRTSDLAPYRGSA